jgi:hypothetical protein
MDAVCPADERIETAVEILYGVWFTAVGERARHDGPGDVGRLADDSRPVAYRLTGIVAQFNQLTVRHGL